MSAILQWILFFVALIPVGVFATFFIILNIIKQQERRIEHEHGKTSK